MPAPPVTVHVCPAQHAVPSVGSHGAPSEQSPSKSTATTACPLRLMSKVTLTGGDATTLATTGSESHPGGAPIGMDAHAASKADPVNVTPPVGRPFTSR